MIYVTKPFPMTSELLARIKANIRRSSNDTTEAAGAGRARG